MNRFSAYGEILAPTLIVIAPPVCHPKHSISRIKFKGGGGKIRVAATLTNIFGTFRLAGGGTQFYCSQ